MKLSLCIFILLGGVVADPIRARRGVLMFLNEALATTTEKNHISTSTVYRNPTNKPEIDPDSEDMSEAQSEETLTDPTSQEIMYSKAAQAAKPASRRRTAADETIKRWVQNQGSEETTDPDSEEDNSPPRVQAVHPSRMAESTTVPDSGSKELQDMDSLEDNGGSPAPADNRGDSGYKGSRELLIPDRSPAAPSENKWRPSHPSKSQRA